MIISLDPPARAAARLAARWCDYYPGAATPEGAAGQAARLPVVSCTAWGLSCPGACAPGGGLLPRRFTLTHSLRRGRFVFCDTFHRAGLGPGASAYSTRHAALWCSDFPLPARARSDHLPPASLCRHVLPRASEYVCRMESSFSHRSLILFRTFPKEREQGYENKKGCLGIGTFQIEPTCRGG